METTGSAQNENEEKFTDRTSAEGVATGFDLGLPASDHEARSPNEADDDESDHEVLEEDLEEGGSSNKLRIKVPKPSEMDREIALEVWGVWFPNIFHNIYIYRFV